MTVQPSKGESDPRKITTKAIEALGIIKELDAREKSPTKLFDTVKSPIHYTDSSIECIDAMIAAYGKTAVKDFCKCNAFKYLWRFEKKNGTEDLNKALWYIKKYIELSD